MDAGYERALEVAKALLVDIDRLDTRDVIPPARRLPHRLRDDRVGHAAAGIEMACLDAAGNAIRRPVHSLLGGGSATDRGRCLSIAMQKMASAASRPYDKMVDRAEELVTRYGIRTIELKGGVLLLAANRRRSKRLAARFPACAVRGTGRRWSVPTSLRNPSDCAQRASTWSTWRTRRVSWRAWPRFHMKNWLPLATNMCLVSHEQLAPGIRLGSVDVILSDVHFWGGFRANQKMMAVCEAFGWRWECTQIASSAFPPRRWCTSPPHHHSSAYAIDSHYPEQTGDVIAEPIGTQRLHRVPPGPASVSS